MHDCMSGYKLSETGMLLSETKHMCAHMNRSEREWLSIEYRLGTRRYPEAMYL